MLQTDRQIPTRALLACGAIGAPAFLVIYHIDAVTRPGYELFRHAPSLMMTGDRGWIQITNFVVTGLLMLACAAGLRRALPPGRGATWGPRLVAAYGLGMVSTGVFVTDAQEGYPPGTPQDALPGVTYVSSWHENLHTVSVFCMYATVLAACVVFARRFAAEPGGRWWATACVATAVAAPAVLITGTLILPMTFPSSDWAPFVDGVLGRVIIPLGWIWAALVPARLLMTPTAAGVRSYAPTTVSQRPERAS